MSKDITLSMTKETFDKELEKAHERGFQECGKVLNSLIDEFIKSGLSPFQYLKEVHPRIPNKVLLDYFYVIDKDWMKRDA